jgi:hypothetical protein
VEVHSILTFQNLNLRAEDLDAAILDRCDESLCFTVPNEECRRTLILDYFTKFVKSMEVVEKEQHGTNIYTKMRRNFPILENNFGVCIDKEVMNETQLAHFVKSTNGFSGREIAKLMISVQGAIYSSSDGKLNYEMVRNVLETKTKEHQMKMEMRGDTRLQKSNSVKVPSPGDILIKPSCGTNTIQNTDRTVGQLESSTSSTYDELTDEITCETTGNICKETHESAKKYFRENTQSLSTKFHLECAAVGAKCTCDVM